MNLLLVSIYQPNEFISRKKEYTVFIEESELHSMSVHSTKRHILNRSIPLDTAVAIHCSYMYYIDYIAVIHCGAKKTAPYYFCHKFVKPSYILILLGIYIPVSYTHLTLPTKRIV